MVTAGVTQLPWYSMLSNAHSSLILAIAKCRVSTSSGKRLFLLIGKKIFLTIKIMVALVHENCDTWYVKYSQHCRVTQQLPRNSCLHLIREVVIAQANKDASSSDCQVFTGMRSSS